MAELPPLERAKRLAEALLSERGEASGAAVARELQRRRASWTPTPRHLVPLRRREFGPDAARLRAADQRRGFPSRRGERRLALAEASEPPRQELLRRMNMTPAAPPRWWNAAGGAGPPARGAGAEAARADLKHLLASWFNRGFLELRRIDWQTPAAVLEKLIEYEAVHEIQGWDDLRRRLAADRRCFGFFHPALPGEPLIFVEVALVEGLASRCSRCSPATRPARTRPGGAPRGRTRRSSTRSRTARRGCAASPSATS
jgi:malonyl-CoA decarboxylase